MKTKIFEYKGYVGIEAGDKLINDPNASGQLGCVVRIDEVEITSKALDFLKFLGKTGDSLGDVMCWESIEGPCFGWLGNFKQVISTNQRGDRDFKPSLLSSQINDDMIVPKDFIAFIDSK